MPSHQPEGAYRSQSSDTNDNLTLDQKILKQIEYYFGDHNLSKDTFLRTKINESPLNEVPISLFTTFPKLSAICIDLPTIVNALRQSTRLIVNKDGTTVRRRVPFTGASKKHPTVVCKLFAAGRCKFGKKCRYKHDVNADAGLGGWTAVEPAEEKLGRKRGRENSDRDVGKGKQSVDSNSAKRQRVIEPSVTDLSSQETPYAPPSVSESTAPVTPLGNPQTSSPSPTPSFHTALAAWGAVHFGPSARQRLPAPPLPPQTYSSDSNGWDTMCASCQTYWTDQYKQQGWVAADPYAAAGAEGDVEAVGDEDGSAYVDQEEDRGEYEEEPDEGSHLTPEMIQIFRHSENWKREKQALRKAELDAAKEEEKAQDAATSSTADEEELTHYQRLEAQFGPAAYEIHSLEKAVEARFAKDEATAKPVLWPVVPIRW
ncbi:hypothetical protein HK097_005827 [Rhizophlyctis rosea]|uniref:C3H1-type domain-containing protein n=1 Tax=Rhizophlyctis rosea TaxID=64517 RepID=A0AAD5SGE5_9FUNG|nr:hypothetical protein HK097_005827 [Rhizophlyctis rosea]